MSSEPASRHVSSPGRLYVLANFISVPLTNWRRSLGRSRPFRRIDWRQPFTQTLDHSRPPLARWFWQAPLTYVITPLTAGVINSRRRWR
ncbi:hypothetical protein KCP78_00330 [Salmonella enterica subsp. enterica]|nr:hypothetical protein KCP78_00330 [Salmonella enterica subsp. enterica]